MENNIQQRIDRLEQQIIEVLDIMSQINRNTHEYVKDILNRVYEVEKSIRNVISQYVPIDNWR